MAKGGFRGGSYGGGRGGFSGGGVNMNAIKKMQEEMLKMQTEMEAKTYDATAGGGMVTAVVNGQYELVSVTIDPEAVDPEDVEMLQDMIVAAVNEAVRTAQKAMNDSMSKFTGGLNLGF